MSDQGKRRAAGFRPDAARLFSVVPKIRRSPPFRSTVAAVAARMRRFGPSPAVEPGDFWLEVRRHLLELPQMRAAGHGAEFGPAAAFGRRSSDLGVTALAPGFGRPTGGLPAASHWFSRIGSQVRISAPDAHDWFIAAALIAFFVLGYLAAMASGA